MEQTTIFNNNSSQPLLKKWREKILRWFRLTNRPTLKVYQGYGTDRELHVFGHVLQISPLPRKKYRGNIWTNTFALIRLFMVKPMPLIKLKLLFNGELVEGESQLDGFFKFQWTPAIMPPSGWHKVQVQVIEGQLKKYYGNIMGDAEIFVPHTGQFAIVSDIDDTFLISHSSNLRKRLYVLLTKNAYSRKPFDGVVKHYQYLALAGTTPLEPNPFFYVSSSEWNLYDYIKDFSKKNELPRGIYLLNEMKRINQFLKTGHSNHGTKFRRISRVIEAFPHHQFILLGDDSQQDPFIYSSVVEHFPSRIKAVYLRNVFKKNTILVMAEIEKMQYADVPVCHFKHSKDAIAHSVEIGLFQIG
ncbi:MAG: phosphatase domain-containing protein [Flavitalea sp.]